MLKKEKVLLNFDGDYCQESFSKKEGILSKEHLYKRIDNELLQECNRISQLIPLRNKERLKWDVNILERMRYTKMDIDYSISSRIYTDVDKLYNPTPMFLIYGIK